ncbi:class I SAM-dependent DNA methyltransferase [Rummeliibacillus pycnus]|uniref:class I SAM-dependent DNA methyltransferase n=1 Tax=Rummeliibacillus pycnus TaxID=101070 RepID=UPI0037CCA0B3
MGIDNFEEYEDAVLYDQENDMYHEDIKFLEKYASTIDGPIIDIACGTGRATIPLAKAGQELIGVDVHEGMLRAAEKKSSELELNIKWEKQDCTNLNLDVKSNLIFTVGNSFQHFLTNNALDGLLSSVHKHLHDGGLFIFGTRFPSLDELLQPPTEEYWRSYIDQVSQQKVDVYTISRYDALTQLQHYTTIRKFAGVNGVNVNEKRTHITLRYVFPKEMERILSNNGFEILGIYKDWNETPIDENSYEMIYVCRKL